jgi:hypothetical protein
MAPRLNQYPHCRSPTGVPSISVDLLGVTKIRIDTMSLGIIDDIVYGVEGKSDKHNIQRLKEILQGAEEWRRRHGAQFERIKYVLVHFTRGIQQSTTFEISLNGITIHRGVIFDQQLWFKAHLQVVLEGLLTDLITRYKISHFLHHPNIRPQS